MAIARDKMSARAVLEIMVRTNRGNMTVWSPAEVTDALDAYRAQVLREAADQIDGISSISAAVHATAEMRRMAEHATP